eukprot:626602-Prymnesium_polylepis.1
MCVPFLDREVCVPYSGSVLATIREGASGRWRRARKLRRGAEGPGVERVPGGRRAAVGQPSGSRQAARGRARAQQRGGPDLVALHARKSRDQARAVLRLELKPAATARRRRGVMGVARGRRGDRRIAGGVTA